MYHHLKYPLQDWYLPYHLDAFHYEKKRIGILQEGLQLHFLIATRLKNITLVA